jgi:hypothetical protein
VDRPDEDESSLPEWRGALRKSENPYASHYYRNDEHPVHATESTARARDQYRASQNPYAFHYYLETQQVESLPQPQPQPAATSALTGRKALSKADFEAGCRSVFRRYMPEMERTKLRAHHQDFIRRNLTCSPERRHALLEALRRYDLSSEQGLRTYFNREEDAFTEDKLLKIERSVTEK